MEEFTEEEKNILKPFVTDLGKPIFCLVNLPEVVKGALFARYSRSPKSLKRVLIDEFVNEPDTGFKDLVNLQAPNTDNQVIAINKAEEFYDRVLIGYGDDSVAELGGAHLAVEQVSQIAAKFIESSRIGISPLEKSTRYIWFDKKVNGEYMYHNPKKIMNSKLRGIYTETCNLLFDTYSKLIPAMSSFFKKRFPKKEDISERGYEATIRAKVCDVLRVFLPAATFTNLGLFGNGRAFEYLLTKMYAHPLDEIRSAAISMHEELRKVIPSFVRRANDEEFGKMNQTFIRETNESMQKAVKNIEKEPEKAEEVTLVEYDKDAELKVLPAILYQHSRMPLNQIKEIIKNLSEDEKRNLVKKYLQKRVNRRHKPGRGFETIFYGFDILANYGIYRDLHRHRQLTQEPQDLTTKHGYDVPPELIEAGFKEEYDKCMEKARQAYEEIYKEFPKEAQYVVPFGYRIRWYINLNLREVFHLTELRSQQQGHPDYRRVAQLIYKKVKEVHPTLTEYLKFVDMNDYELERLNGEKFIDQRLKEVKEKYG
ncbi:FAD-dependent thymidylate synthase [Candidatus Woesearchaeota archaeon]|nr:FAD-dependent thymidylate synthase [Candidatus Woesearchaeota archaeon]